MTDVTTHVAPGMPEGPELQVLLADGGPWGPSVARWLGPNINERATGSPKYPSLSVLPTRAERGDQGRTANLPFRRHEVRIILGYRALSASSSTGQQGGLWRGS